MLSDEYLAGVFDAVGAVGISRTTNQHGNTKHMLTVHMTHKDRALLGKVEEECGGSLTPMTGTKWWQWMVASRKAVTFLQRVHAHTLRRREEITIALEFAATIGPSGRGGTSPERIALRDEYREMLRAKQRAA